MHPHDQQFGVPGWYPDPLMPDAVLWFDGVRFTGQRAKRVPVPRPPRGTLPRSVALWAVVLTAVPLVVGRTAVYLLSQWRWPVAVYVAIAGVIAYVPGLVLWQVASRRHMGGHACDAVGFRIRLVDLGWGPLTWLAAVAAELAMAAVLAVLHIPVVSNTDSFGDIHQRRGYVVALLLLAVVVAPVAEEIVFRGLLLRGLMSSMRPWAAIAVQAVLFGAAHMAPERGWGNVGLALMLGAVGGVFGVVAVRTRRLAPSMIAHAMVNAIALAVVFSR